MLLTMNVNQDNFMGIYDFLQYLLILLLIILFMINPK